MTAATDNRPAPQQVTEDEQRAAMERAKRGMGRKAWRGSEFVRSEADSIGYRSVQRPCQRMGVR